MVSLLLDYALLIDKGLVRERNEDRCGAFEPSDPQVMQERGILFVVADGMGGHAAGDVAAQIAIDTMNDTYFSGEWTTAEEKLRDALVTANEAILSAAREGGRHGMGAASVAVAILGDRAVVGHLGDCRGYLVQSGSITRLTSDHSWVQERMDAGRLTADEARVHPYRNVLTRALGAEVDAQPEVNEIQLRAGQVIVLCSDGLWGQTDDEELAQVIASSHDAAAAARGLVDLALARGGPDNISVIVIRALDPNRDVPTARLPMKREQGTTATE